MGIEVFEQAGDGIESVRALAIDWLSEHAAPHGVVWNFREFALKAVCDGEVAGVLVASTNLQWLHISLLSVRPTARRGGIGRALLAKAEEIARSRDCIGVWLDTYDFQAPDYYPKLGFEVVGRIDDMPVGHSRTFFSKRL